MDFILWIVFGAIVGWLSSIFTGTNRTRRGINSILIGVIAAVIGGAGIYKLYDNDFEIVNIYALLGASTAASLVLWFWERHKSNKR